jgi:predicted small lipoprotein YifL
MKKLIKQSLDSRFRGNDKKSKLQKTPLYLCVIFAVLSFNIILSGCGQKGSLYLPKHKTYLGVGGTARSAPKNNEIIS